MNNLHNFPWATASDWRHVTMPEGRYTEHLSLGWTRPGPTTILKPWNKGDGLVDWGAELEREGVIERASTILNADIGRDAVDGPTFAAKVRASLGEKGWFWRKRRDQKGDLGSQAHEYLEWWLKLRMGVAPSVPPERPDLPTLDEFEAWFGQSNTTPLRLEQCVWSDAMEVCGAADFIGIRNGRLGIADLKTSNYLSDGHHYQLACYAACVEEMTGIPVEWAELWHCPFEVGKQFRVVPLGNVLVWAGFKPYTKVISRPELIRGFQGLAQAWKLTCVPPRTETPK